MAKRKPMSKRKRFEIFKRDGFACQYCGRKPPQVMLQVDHVIAVAAGGDDDSLNLTTACEDCNSGKSDKPLQQTLPSQQLELLRRAEIAEQTKALNKFLAKYRAEQDESVIRLASQWSDMTALPNEPKGQWMAGESYRRSLRTFLKSLPEFEVLDAMELAHNRMPVEGLKASDYKTWKYFCGICWRKIKGDERNDRGERHEAQDF